MTNLPQLSRPVRDSILAAASAVAAAAFTPGQAPQAVRDATLAVEFHLDALAKALSRREIEPRLLERARAIEARLREVLMDSWQVERDLGSGTAGPHRIQELARTIRAAGDRELDLVFEQIRDIGAMD